jgi:hypothetical protein
LQAYDIGLAVYDIQTHSRNTWRITSSCSFNLLVVGGFGVKTHAAKYPYHHDEEPQQGPKGGTHDRISHVLLTPLHKDSFASYIVDGHEEGIRFSWALLEIINIITWPITHHPSLALLS